MSPPWLTKTVGELCTILDSQRQPITKRDRVKGPYPYYGATGVLDRVASFLFNEPLVLLGEDGAKWGAGDQSAFPIAGPAWVNNHAHVLRPDRSHLRDEWLIYWLNFQDLTRFVTGLTVPKLNQEMLRSIPVPVPPLPEQHRIVAILDEAFEAIATATANAEKNLANARELSSSYLETIFGNQWNNWPTRAIRAVGDVFDGPHATPKTIDTGPIFLNISTLQDGELRIGETRHVTESDFETWTRRVQPQADDIVFSYETRLGEAALIPEGLRCCLGRRMGLLRIKDHTIMNPKFFLFQYISRPFRRFLTSKTVRGATVDRISIKDFPNFPVRIPPAVEQRRIVAQTETMRSEVDRLVAIQATRLTHLSELRQSLLARAFSGELTASTAIAA